MTSILRSFATPSLTPVKFNRLESPSYMDTDLGYITLIPFSYANGTLDIRYIDAFEADMVDTPGQAPETDPDVAVQLLGGVELVQTLGPNFQAYIRAWRDPDAGTPISIYINGTMQKVQAIRNSALGDDAYEVSTTPPSSDNYTQGTVADSYRANWIFKAPLTIVTIETGVKHYITFTSRLDRN